MHKYKFSTLRISIPGVITIITLLYMIVPLIIIVPMSFEPSNYAHFPPSGFSLKYYIALISSPEWIQPILLSFEVAIGTTILSLVIGLPSAYGLLRGNLLGINIIRALLFSPVVIPAVVLAIGLYFYFSALNVFGSLWTLVISHTAFVLPFVLITIMSGLSRIDMNLDSAAKIMGAGELTSFIKVIIPTVKPYILGAGLFAFIMSFDEPVISYFVTNIDSLTLPVKMYESIQWNITPILSVIATILIVTTTIICLIYMLITTVSEDNI